MSTTDTIELTLDTADGVEQFLDYVQDVVFAASRYEAEALELALQDPSHTISTDALSDELHELYSRMRGEIAACASRGGMTIEEAGNLQAQYNDLVRLRNEIKVVIQTPVATSTSRSVPERRKTLILNSANSEGTISITATDSAKQYGKTRQQPQKPKQPPQPATQRGTQAPKPTTKPHCRPNTPEKPKHRPAADLPSPGVMKPTTDRSLKQLPLLSLVTDGRLIQQMTAHPRPKQLEFKIKSVVDSIESEQTDRLAAWLGDAHEHTFSYIKSMTLSELYDLAALSIQDLRAELAPKRVRPEAFLHWVRFVTDVQVMVPSTPQQTVGEVVVTALVLQELPNEV